MLIYNFLYFFFVLFSIPLLLIKGKWHPAFWMRLGIWPEALKNSLKHKNNLWIHAVSVGEILAVQGLIKELKARFPSHQVVVTTVTKTGYQLAAHKFKDEIVVYAPLDFNFSVEHYVHFIKPKIYISAETEIWPNLFRTLKDHHTKIVLVNGRISQKSLDRYKLVRPFLRPVLDAVTFFCMQTAEDAGRVKALGVPENRIKVTGNMKFDDTMDEIPSRLKSLEWLSGELLWIAGSTHKGEEVIALRTFQKLVKEFGRFRLMIAPRHVERTDEIEELIREYNFTPKRLSKFHSSSLSGSEVLVVDTIGDLRYLYALASIVFIGKTLAAQGGQNILEPAFFGKPIVVGPHMQNFKDVMHIFKTHGALLIVQDENDLCETLRALLGDADRRTQTGRLARETLLKFRGATTQTLQTISPLIS